MKKVIFLLTFLYSLSFAEPGDKREYRVDRITGLNAVTDSINLPPEEALELSNFVLDKFGAVHKRYGVDPWNDSLISGGKIWNIHYIEDKNADKMLFFASNIYINERKTWEDTTDWTASEVSYSRGIIDTAENGQRYIYGDSTSWILAVDVDDIIEFEGDDAQRWQIDSVLADTILHITANLTSAHGDTTTYRIIKHIANPTLAKSGYADLSSWGGKLYVADGSHEPWYYDGDQPQLLGIVDSGTVTTAAVIDTTIVPYDSGTVVLTQGSNIIQLTGGDIGDTLSNGDSVFVIGSRFKAWLTYERQIEGHHTNTITSRIIGKSIAESLIYLANAIDWDDWSHPQGEATEAPPVISLPIANAYWNGDWQVMAKDIRITTKQYQYLEDTTKYFPVGTEINYKGFWVVNGDNATKRGYISSNTDRIISFDSTGVGFATGDRYYIVRQHAEMRHPIIDWGYSPYPNPFGDDPYPLVPTGSTYTELNYFRQIIFHRNRLYAIGYSIVPKAAGGFSVGDTINTGRVWFSDIAMPRYIFADWNFDVTGANTGNQNLSLYSADACQRMFVLRDDLYIITNSNIYRLSGEPDVTQEGYGLYLSQVVRGIGTNQPYGIVTTKDNVAYIMNQEGIWLFDGDTIEKFSYKIDPLVERYRNSRMTASKFKDNIFFSYPDSNITIVMHDPTKGFTTWDIGMLTINDQSVAIDSNYFLFSRSVNSSYVLKYPKSLVGYTDLFVPGAASSQIAISYRSGWQSLGPIDFARVIEQAAFQITKGPENVHTLIYGDFDLTDTLHIDTSGSSGHHIVRFRMSNDNAKDYYQFHVKNASSSDLTLSGYYIKCRDSYRK